MIWEARLVILVVDDEPDLCSWIAMELEDAGHKVMTAQRGAEALAMVLAQTFDLVISDIHMPGMSGLELETSLRETRPHLRFVLLSGNAPVNGKTMPNGTVVMPKPLDFDLLFRVVNQELKAS